MTSTFTDTGRKAAINDYVQRCRPYLLDLTTDQQDQLEDDICQIVGEVAMELNGQPDDLVGPPLRFVAELRTAAGLPLQPPPTPPNHAPGQSSTVATAGSVLRGLYRWSRGTATPWVMALAKDLRPAAWVLRGVGVAFIAGAMTQEYGHQGIIPNLYGSPVLGILATIGAVVASVEVGRKRLTGRRQRLAIAAASIASAIAVVIAVGSYDQGFEAGASNEAVAYDDGLEMATATTVVSQLEGDGAIPFLNEPTRSTITFLTDSGAPMTEPITTAEQAHAVLGQIEAQGFSIGAVSLDTQTWAESVGADVAHGKNSFGSFDEAHYFVEDFFATP